MKLTDEEDKKISDQQITDIQAYEYYLKAKNEINSWTEPGMERRWITAQRIRNHG